MATYSASIEFVITAKNDEKAQALADRIAAYVQQEKMASDAHQLDLERLDDDEGVEELRFEEDDE